MHGLASDISILALFNLGGGEIILVLALPLILFGAKRFCDPWDGLGRGIDEFRSATDKVAGEAGESVGGIYGKRAAEALTIDNQVAEHYDPEALCDNEKSVGFNKASIFLNWSRLGRWIRNLFLRRLKKNRG